MRKPLPRGVFAAALTPLKPDGALDLENVLPYLDFLARRGCHGALLFGTTGEGPSFSPAERMALGRIAVDIRGLHPDFMLLMGTGTPSLAETIELTRGAFDLGMQGVVVLPPYFNRKVTDEGLFTWFSQVMRKAVPGDGLLLGYNIPQMTGVSLSINLIDRLKSGFPNQFAGVKNSWTEAGFVQDLGDHFGPDLVVMTGYDNLFQLSLSKHASGCITASATLISPLLRQLWEQARSGQDPSATQLEVNRIRAVMESCPPTPALIKGLLARWHAFPRWDVCPPMIPVTPAALDSAAEALHGPF
jgi:4-hydroxy-tetrahydrodipicolinate synthase